MMCRRRFRRHLFKTPPRVFWRRERAEKNTEGMQFRLELQQGKVEELEGTDKTSCRDTTNAWARL